MNMPLREWKKFENENLGQELEKIKELLPVWKETLEKTLCPGFFLVQRNGVIRSAGDNAIEFCNRILHVSTIENFTPYSLFIIEDNPEAKIHGYLLRLLRKFRLDCVISIHPGQAEKIPFATLKILDGNILSEVEQELLTLFELCTRFSEKYFLSRTDQVDIRKISVRTDEVQKRAFIVTLEFTSNRYKISNSNQGEMKGLAKTLNFAVLGTLSQKLQKPHAGTFFGSGKLEEMLQKVEEEDYSHILFNCDLPSSVKMRITESTLLHVWDRTELILQIFLQHAHTERSRLQVELAKLEYHSDQIIKDQLQFSKASTHQEKEVYVDKARLALTEKKKTIREKLQNLREQHSERSRERITDNHLSLALIGYTNAGKSTLFNSLLGKKIVAAEDVLFKTLETTTRILEISNLCKLTISDTVGFVEDLPRHLQEAFHTTLAESKNCTHLLILLDPLGIGFKNQMDVMKKTLHSVNRSDEQNWIWIANKKDLFTEDDLKELNELGIETRICAHDLQDIESLKKLVLERTSETREKALFKLNWEEFSIFHKLKTIATVLSEPEYHENCVTFELSFEKESIYKIEQLFGKQIDQLKI